MDIKEHGARRIAHVGGVYASARQLPQKPAVHRAKGEFAMCGLCAGIGHMVQNPLQLGTRKISIHQQAGFLANGWCHAALAQGCAGGLGAAVLPDDGFVDGLASLAIPDHGGFTLVGDADGVYLLRADASFGQHIARRGQLGSPNFKRVVLHPAGVRVKLGQLLLRHGHDPALRVKHDAAGTRGALVKGE